MTFADVDTLWWSAFIGGALWGAIIATVCLLLAAAVVRLWRQERKPGRS